VTRRALAALAGACLLAAGLSAAPERARAQDWRADAIASFDAAWQTINDTFPDPKFGGVDWPAVAKELRPRVETASTPDAAREVIREMLARLKRSHFVLLAATPDMVLAGPASIPVEVRIFNGEAVVTRVTDSSATTAGLSAGQVIVSVDGAEAAPAIRGAQGADERTKNLDAWRRVNQLLYGAETSQADVAVRNADGSTRTIRVARTLGAGETVTLGNLPPLRVVFEQHEARTPAGHRAGVIAFSLWMTPVSDPFERAINDFRSASGIVIDLRGNPGGLAAMMRGIAGHFVDQPLVIGTMHTRQGDLSFSVNPRLATSDGRSVKPFAGPVALLIDELTGSTSETFAGGMQSLGRVRVFGRPSMGQALPALTRTLPNGDVLMYAIGDFVTSTGKRIEGNGVTPDTVVPLSIAALAAGKDEPLDAALRWIDEARR
jgi:carboxyl-terminal processing protease